MPLYVNKVEITDEDIFREMQYHPAENREAARDKAARALVIHELLKQEAVEQNILASDADDTTTEKAIENLLEVKVKVPQATRDTCRHYYDHNIERFSAAKGANLPLPFDVMEHRIREYLSTRSIRQGIQAYILDLAARHRISGFDLASTL